MEVVVARARYNTLNKQSTESVSVELVFSSCRNYEIRNLIGSINFSIVQRGNYLVQLTYYAN